MERERVASAAAAATSAREAAQALEAARADLAREIEASAARERAASASASAAREELDRSQAEALASLAKAAAEHKEELAAAHRRTSELAAAFDAEATRQRERSEALVAEIKAAAATQLSMASSGAAERWLRRAPRRAGGRADRGEHHRQQMQSLARARRDAALDRQLAAQSSAARDRADDASVDWTRRRATRSASSSSARPRPPPGGGGGGDRRVVRAWTATGTSPTAAGGTRGGARAADLRAQPRWQRGRCTCRAHHRGRWRRRQRGTRIMRRLGRTPSACTPPGWPGHRPAAVVAPRPSRSRATPQRIGASTTMNE